MWWPGVDVLYTCSLKYFSILHSGCTIEAVPLAEVFNSVYCVTHLQLIMTFSSKDTVEKMYDSIALAHVFSLAITALVLPRTNPHLNIIKFQYLPNS